MTENAVRAVVIAGHRGDVDAVRSASADPDPHVRAAALAALRRCGVLDAGTITAALADPDASVRRRAAMLSAHDATVDLLGTLHDDDPDVVEAAAWACGEHATATDEVLDRLHHLTAHGADPLVREASVAALGAIGDERSVTTIIAACADKPAIRRRAMLALAPFDGDHVRAALHAGRSDRDWQVRQAAVDVLRASGEDVDELPPSNAAQKSKR